MKNPVSGDTGGSLAPVLRRRRVLGMAAAIGGIATLVGCGSEDSPLAGTPTPTPSGSPTPTPTPSATPTITSVSDNDLLNLSLQIAYLQAQFYSLAILGVPLPASLTSGTGAAGAVTGARQVTIADSVLGEMLAEIAFGKISLVTRLRAALGSAVTAAPAIDLGTTDASVFTVFARNAGVVTAPALFDVYADQKLFLQGAFILEDIAVNAFKGHLQMVQAGATTGLIGGLLSAAAHHAAVVRSQLYLRDGATGTTLRLASLRLSDWRDQFAPSDDDQGVTNGSVKTPGATANIVPTDGEGVVYGRLPQLTLNTVYARRTAGEGGGFFPAGVNGAIRSSINT